MTPRPRPTAAESAAAHRPDKARVRRHAARAAQHYEQAAWLPRQVAEALMEHLEPVRITPRRILDAGAGTGIGTRRLARAYPSARVVSLDASLPMLRAARGGRPRWLRLHGKRVYACGDAEALPVAGASIDLVVSNLMLPSCTTPDAAFAEFHRVLKPGGLLMFSSLGPDTLHELRESWSAIDSGVHVHAFIDMHDVGDALMRAGFRDVVMDSERFTAEYPDVTALMDELKHLGVSNAAVGSRAGLTTRTQLRAMAAEYERHRRKASLPASFEVVFGHAWRNPATSVDVPGDDLMRSVEQRRQR